MLQRLVISTVFLLLWVPIAHGQAEFTVEGTVTDASSGDPLPGANVVVKGTSRGTSTNTDGEYSLDVLGEDVTLVFSFVGYETKEIPVRGRSEINVTLQPASLEADELVVVGYGTQEARDVTGSVTSLRSADFSEGVNTSLDDLIGEQVAGVRFIQSSNNPGSGISLNIRGASSINAGSGPLYVIDGVPVNKSSPAPGGGDGFANSRSDRNPLNTINPSDIESIEILKDASATAIYGSRGANGVVLIQTKSGGGELNVSYNGSIGAQTRANSLDILTPQQYKSVLNGIIEDGGGNPEAQVGDIANGGAGTNWQNVVFREQPLLTNHNVSFSGGSETVNYYSSLSYFNQSGIVENSSLERYTARLNVDLNVSEDFTTGLKLNTSYVDDSYASNGFGINLFAGAVQSAYNYDPTLPVRNDAGDYVFSEFTLLDNPQAILDGETSVRNTYRTFGTFYSEYDLIEGLTFRVNLSGDVTNQETDTYVGTQTQFGAAAGGIATVNDGRQTNWLAEGTLNYDGSFGDIHSVDATVGVTYERGLDSGSFISAEDFPSDATKTDNLGLANPNLTNINSRKFTNTLVSYIGRVNYSLFDKYRITSTFRADGSSRFGENNRFGYFPSAAVAWSLGQEEFLANVEQIEELKLRASWGQTGNQSIGDLQFATTFGSGPNATIDGQQVASLVPTRLGNQDLKWETTEQFDIGLDFSLLGDRISGSFDYFWKTTEDMLVNLPVPTSTGFNARLDNVGSIRNTGVEVSLNTTNIGSGNFEWSSKMSASTLNNEVVSLGPINEIITGGAGFTSQIGVIREGLPLFSFYGYQVEGIWQEGDDFSQTDDPVQPGSIKYRDVNGDGTVNAEDRVPLGNSFPDFSWSFGNEFSYRDIRLNVLLTGTEGIQMLNNNLVDSMYPISFRRNKMATPYLNRWTPENPSNKWPSFVRPNAQGNKAVNSLTVEDASYVRLKRIRLSYRIPEGVLPTIGSASIYATAENVFTITDYMGPDPSVNPNGNPNFRIDFNSVPLLRTYTFGVRIDI
jgi:TonB-linked SusC/RagA family outer membrane protein